MCGCLCERTYCKLGTCSGRQVQGHVPVTVPTYNKGPEQWKHCSSGTKVCEPDCPRVHLLPAVANSFSQGEKDGGQYIFLKGRVGPSILMWNGQNRESEVNVKPWWITGMHYHIFSFTESIKRNFLQIGDQKCWRELTSGMCLQCLWVTLHRWKQKKLCASYYTCDGFADVLQ